MTRHEFLGYVEQASGSVVTLALLALMAGCSQTDRPTAPEESPTFVPYASSHSAGHTRVSGGGEVTAQAFVTYVGHDGVNRNVPSINTTGNRVTFGFNASKDGSGHVKGQMQLRDHTLGLVIHSDVVGLSVPHPVHGTPVAATGLGASMNSSSQGVLLNGQPAPGWVFANSPLFDGGEDGGSIDTICFELFDAAGVRVLQWSATLSAGNVQIVQ
ncbi:MAG: hypothetical protein L0271_12040 [Gemmatimonadetes bacterium]|nr:hypothetical protein [Gemmatimonadota bacterium]